MTLEELAFVAEIVGGIAVVATLIYLAIEVRRNTTATRSSAQYTQIDTISNWNLALIHVPDLPDLIVKANEDYSSVTDTEKLKLQGYYVNAFNLWHAAYWNLKNGLLDEKGFNVWDGGCSMLFSAQIGAVKTWDSIKHIYDEEFRNHAQSKVSKETRPTSAPSVIWAETDSRRES